MDTTVVLIHGTNAGPWTMSNFAGHFEQRGFRCHSPAYRYHDKPPSEETSKLLAGISIADYVEDIAGFVETLDAPPILVGHSLGGVVAQKLAASGLAGASTAAAGRSSWRTRAACSAKAAIAPIAADLMMDLARVRLHGPEP
jgi:pimeloyl-ACP methyl ester carboxylesterase